MKVEGGYPVDDELIAITPRYSGARFEGGRPPGPWEIRPFGPILGSLSRRSLMRFSSKWDPIAATVLGVLMVVALVFAPLLALVILILAIALGIARGVVHERRVRGL